MAVRTHHVTTRSPRYTLGPGADLPIARLIALLLLAVPLAALVLASNLAKAGPSPEAQQLASFNPRQLFGDNTPHFLPTPTAAMPAETDAGPPVPAASEDQANATNAVSERVKIANTGGIGAILRAEPPSGHQVAGLRDGVTVTVLEHRTVGDTEWLRVRTDEGVEGWVYGKLVGPAQ
jgi:hypothetical protein